MTKRIIKPGLQYLAMITFVALIGGCTGSSSGFKLQEQTQNFKSLQQVNTKLDMLWVVDNSGSMESAQTRVRAGIQQFAQQYMKPSWDIRVASITTDTYLADPTFSQGPQGQASYLTTVRAGTANYQMPYLYVAYYNYGGGAIVPARSKHYYDSTSWVTSANFPLFNLFQPAAYHPPTVTHNTGGTEKFLSAGMRIIDAKPQLGANWAKLLIGNHDGPQLSMCWDQDESSPQYIFGLTACYHRDDPADSQYHVGIANCASPNTGNGETGPSQCVNTLANNSAHTGLPIISTIPPTGVPADQTWTNNLIANFQVNLTPSTVGNGNERAFQSVLQFLKDNESDPTYRFFRPDALRVLVFVGDEDDQSMFVDANQYQYGTNNVVGTGAKTHIIAENASAPFICKKSYPAPASGNYYPFGDTGYCVDPAWALPVPTVKQNLDSFFHQLDGSTASQGPNYFVATITTMNTAGLVQQGYNYISQRYPELVNEVGNGSVVLDITQSDYTPLLNQVGQTILQNKAQFTLARAPTSQEETYVSIVHGNGTATALAQSQFTVAGLILTITDLNVIAAFSSTDSIQVTYQATTQF